MADVVLFWVPRELRSMPAFTTNDEWGAYKHTGKVVFGAPPGAEKIRYQQYYAAKLHVPTADTLEGAVAAALDMLGAGVERRGGERSVPLHVWRTAAFQAARGARASSPARSPARPLRASPRPPASTCSTRASTT